jgi:hypothetical protein
MARPCFFEKKKNLQLCIGTYAVRSQPSSSGKQWQSSSPARPLASGLTHFCRKASIAKEASQLVV